ncbi:MAG TPA: TPM domain-containing protein [Gemmatirosa sp.]|nr:TPM domain-containing protein [Gemmatirosa sp.]
MRLHPAFRPWLRRSLVALALAVAGLPGGPLVGAAAAVAVAASPERAAHGVLGAQPAPSTPRDFQVDTLSRPAAQVNDYAGVLDAAARERLEGIARAVREASGGEIAVVTLADIGLRDASDVALQIGRRWGVGAASAIGQRTRNAGVVVLLVPKETSGDGRGKFAIATGQGTEGFVTDAQTGDIRRESLELRRAARYGDALELTVVRLAQAYGREFGFSVDSAVAASPWATRAARRPAPQAPTGGINPVVALVIFFVVVSLLSSLGGRRRRGCGAPIIIPFPMGGGGGGGWSSGGWGSGGGWGGGGGGGFGGFGGGGGFSGGGSSDSW